MCLFQFMLAVLASLFLSISVRSFYVKEKP